MIATVRTVKFTIVGDTVNPLVPQYAGVQGEHNATLLSFELPKEWNAAYQYRLEYVDGLQHAWVTPVLEASGGTVSYPIPKDWTRAGGMGEARLCAMLLDEQKQERQYIYTQTGRIYFSSQEDGGPRD